MLLKLVLMIPDVTNRDFIVICCLRVFIPDTIFQRFKRVTLIRIESVTIRSRPNMLIL